MVTAAGVQDSVAGAQLNDLMARRLTGETTVSWHDPASQEQTLIPGW